MASYLWRKYADYLHTKWEKTLLWDMIEPYRRPKSFTPLVTIYICAFYTGVIGAAITEQLYKEKYWEDHPGEAVPLMKPKFYGGPWRVMRGFVKHHTCPWADQDSSLIPNATYNRCLMKLMNVNWVVICVSQENAVDSCFYSTERPPTLLVCVTCVDNVLNMFLLDKSRVQKVS
ncbi:UNVERIFIED_CONTAM: hypothetical protein Sradi_3363300 [Sesamum radiatum]|uniref:Embryo defective protein n=1 Tax=Sesamum radiatum TaxID=300843 RepID=A0AAW2R3D4_SESRA